MANEEQEVFGFTYVTDDALGISDRNSSVGEANMRTIRAMAEENNLRLSRVAYSTWTDWSQWGEQGYSVDQWERVLGDQGEPPDLIELYGGYGGGHIWVRIPPDDDRTDDEGAEDPHEDLREVVETVHALEDYPLINDDEHAEVENEWEAEAWENWLRFDLLATLPSDFWRDRIEDRDAVDRILFVLFHEAMDASNTYGEYEGQGMWIDVNAIKDAFFETVVDATTASSSRPHAVRRKDDSEREWLTKIADWLRAEIEEEYDRMSPREDLLEPLQDEYARLQDEIGGLP